MDITLTFKYKVALKFGLSLQVKRKICKFKR
jgi:hypothetical protein